MDSSALRSRWLLDGNALVLVVPEGEVHVLQALRGGTLVKIINRGTDNDALAAIINSESSDLNFVLVLNRLNVGGFTDDLDKLLASVSVLVNLANLPRSHLLGQRDVNGE